MNPVIEESHEYSVTPSRVIQTNTVSPAKETSANKKQQKKKAEPMPDIEQLYDEPSDFIMPPKAAIDERRNTSFRTLNVNEFVTTADAI